MDHLLTFGLSSLAAFVASYVVMRENLATLRQKLEDALKRLEKLETKQDNLMQSVNDKLGRLEEAVAKLETILEMTFKPTKI